MATADELKVVFRAEVDRAIREMERHNQAMRRAQRHAEDFAKALLRQAVAPVAAVASINGLIRTVGGLVEAYQEQERVEGLVRASILASGEVVEALMPRYKALAAEIQNTTTVGDEEALTLIQQARSYGVMNDKVEEAVKGAIGLSKAYGVDLHTALRAVANAMGGNYETIQRYIPAMRGLTDEAEKQKVMQEALANAFEIAKGEAETVGGKYAQLKNAVGDLAQVYGSLLAESASPFIAFLTKQVQKLTEATEKSIQLARVQKLLTEGKYNEVSAQEKIIYYQNKLREIDEQIAFYTDENYRGQLAISGVSEEYAREQVAQLRAERQNIEELLKRLGHKADVEKQNVTLAQKQAELKKQQELSERKAAEEAKKRAEEEDKARKKAQEDFEKRIKASEEEMDRLRIQWASMRYGYGGAEYETFIDPEEEIRVAQYVRERQEEEDRKKADAARREAERWKESWMGAFGTIEEGIFDLWGMSIDASRQRMEAEIAALEKQKKKFEENYQAELALKQQLGIDTLEFEAEYQKKKQAMDEEIARREQALKRKQFEQEKRLRIAETVAAGAQAVVQTFANFGWPIGIPMAAAMAGVTAAKVAMIQAQKFPAMEEGGVVKPVPGGTIVRVAEAGKPEAILPLEKAKEYGLGPGAQIVINVSGVIGDRYELARWIQESINRAKKTGAIV